MVLNLVAFLAAVTEGKVSGNKFCRASITRIVLNPGGALYCFKIAMLLYFVASFGVMLPGMGLGARSSASWIQASRKSV